MSENGNTYFHSVGINTNACRGCIHCIKFCPMEAIRVRDRKAVITAERCIDCAECVRNCTSHAAHATVDNLSILKEHKYNVALASEPLFGQFKNMDDPNIILTALLELGFDDVFEVAVAAEIVANENRRYIENHPEGWPYINTACPAVVRLVRMRYTDLADHLLPVQLPAEVAASLALEKAMKETGLPAEDIGIIHITPCPALAAYSKEPLGIRKSKITGNIAVKSLYRLLLLKMPDVLDHVKPLSKASAYGLGVRACGAEPEHIHKKYLSANGVQNVLEILEKMEDDMLEDFAFVNLFTCDGGCSGGALNVQNAYIARADLRPLRAKLPREIPKDKLPFAGDISWNQRIQYDNVYRLGSTMQESMARLSAAERIEKELPGLDCGSCGAPSCRALAEDIVQGKAFREDCMFLLRDHVHALSGELDGLSSEITETIETSKGMPTRKQVSDLQDFISKLQAELDQMDIRYRT